MSRRWVAVLGVALILLAGCGGSPNVEDAPTTSVTNESATTIAGTSPATTTDTPSSTATTNEGGTSSAIPGATETTTAASTDGPVLSVHISNRMTLDDSEYASALSLAVTANTTLSGADLGGGPGDPYLLVEVDGQEVTRTAVEQTEEYSGTIAVTAADFGDLDRGTYDLTVSLMDEDLVVDDEIAVWTQEVHLGTATTDSGATTETTAQTTTRTATPTTTTAPTTSAPPTTTTTTPTTTEEQTEWTVTVIEVTDGDTLTVAFDDGSTTEVRLLGVDTPEVHVENDPAEFEGIPETESGSDWLRDWGHKASEFARTELKGDEVRLTVDETADRRDRYDRLLAYVHTSDGDLFNRALLEQGYARLYESEFTKRSAFETAEADAQSGDVGLWGYEDTTTTEEPTTTEESADDSSDDDDSSGSSQGELVVTEIHEDAAGPNTDDREDLNDEYIVLKNTGDVALDLSGWTVRDEVDHTYTIRGVTLDPGATLTLYTGTGESTGTDLYWGSGSPIWNNGGDTITVTNANGTTVVEREYS